MFQKLAKDYFGEEISVGTKVIWEKSDIADICIEGEVEEIKIINDEYYVKLKEFTGFWHLVKFQISK